MAKKLFDTDLTELLGIPNTTLRDWKKYDSDNWRKRLYDFLKSHSKEELQKRITPDQTQTPET